MNENCIIIRSCKGKHYNDWADRFVLVYSKFNGRSITFPLKFQLRAIEIDGMAALMVAESLKETHPEIYEHALAMARMMVCDIEEHKVE